MKRMEKRFGDVNTHLKLTEKAMAVYSSTDPISIYERETEDGYIYRISGAIVLDYLADWEVSDFLECLAD